MCWINRGLFASTHGDNFDPDGKIVFPRTETRTFYDRGAAGNSAGTGYDLTLVVKDGKLGCVNASRLARDGRLPVAPRVKPLPVPITQRGYIVDYPEKRDYMAGDREQNDD